MEILECPKLNQKRTQIYACQVRPWPRQNGPDLHNASGGYNCLTGSSCLMIMKHPRQVKPILVCARPDLFCQILVHLACFFAAKNTS